MINLGAGIGAAVLDVGIQLALNGGKFECVKLGEVAVAFGLGEYAIPNNCGCN